MMNAWDVGFVARRIAAPSGLSSLKGGSLLFTQPRLLFAKKAIFSYLGSTQGPVSVTAGNAGELTLVVSYTFSSTGLAASVAALLVVFPL